MFEVKIISSEKSGKAPPESRRKFLLDFSTEKVEVEGYETRKALIQYLMKRRRSLLFTRDPSKVEKMFEKMPTHVEVISPKSRKSFNLANNFI